MKKYFYFLLGILIASIGDSLCFKANIGVSPYEALALTFSYMSHIKVGTFTIIVNITMILLQILMTKKFKIKYCLQFVMSLLFGVIINTIVYQFLSHITLNYMQSLTLEILGMCLSASGCGLLVYLDIVVFPCEGFALTFSNVYHIEFKKVRQILDIILVIVCISLSLIFQCGFALREGTIIAALFFSSIMGFVKEKLETRLPSIETQKV